jgi:hypothetical protein
MTLANRWDGYWFRSAPLVDLAILRIVCVGMQLWLLIFQRVYNYGRLVELSVLPDEFYWPLPIFRLLTLPFGWGYRPSLEVLTIVYGITLVTGCCAFIGFRTNLSLVIFAAGNLILQAFSYSFGDMHHPEALMIIALFALSLSPSGAVLSVDDIRGRTNDSRSALFWFRGAAERKSEFALWPLLLIQVLLSLVYFDAAMRKLSNAGLYWMNGYTLQYALLHRPFGVESKIGIWIGHYHELTRLLSIITLLWELTFFFVLIWRRTAWIYVPLGLALHIGMCVTNIACFYQYMALYTAFVEWTPLLQYLGNKRRVSNDGSTS